MSRDTLDRLMDMMQALRSADSGCPWDRKQTLQSLTPHTLEETHEVISAIESGDLQSLKDELGDLLFQVVFYAQIASEDGEFDLTDVIEHLISKMHRRHPHVFANQHFTTEAALKQHWETTKQLEKQAHANDNAFSSVLDDIPRSMPALSTSQKLQNRAAQTGFDWQDIDRVKEKLSEEIGELDKAISNNSHAEIEHEVGDLLTVCVNLARHLNIDAEQALRLANNRFRNRFNYIENYYFNKNQTLSTRTLEELEACWQKAKDDLDDG